MNQKFLNEEKILLVLHPFKFTEFRFYLYELYHLEKKKNYKVIIHDLSSISSNKEYDAVWKTKIEKKAIKIPSLFSWIREFNQIKKKNILIYDFLDYGRLNFRVFVVKLFLMFSKLPILKHGVKDVAEWKPKKNMSFFLRKIFEHKLNLKVYLFAIRENFFLALIKLIKFNKIFLMTNKDFNAFKHKENIYLIKCHSFDYSNSLLEKYNNPNKINKKRYIVYLDSGAPYFPGDYSVVGKKPLKINTKTWYKELNLFFDKLEKFFKVKIIIVPHSKYKIAKLKNKNLNPYFNNRLSDNSYNAAAKLIPKSLFVVSPMATTALSHVIINYKPAQFIYSKKYTFGPYEKKSLFLQANLIGMKPIDITSTKKRNLIRNLKINKPKYDSYKFKYLTYKNAKLPKPNHKIIEELMDKSI